MAILFYYRYDKALLSAAAGTADLDFATAMEVKLSDK